MNVSKIVSIFALTFAAASAFAASPVEQYGRTAATAGNGATATITACADRCDVSKVQGRAALNYIQAARPAVRGSVMARNAGVDAVFGRAS